MFPTPKQVIYDVPVDTKKYDTGAFVNNIDQIGVPGTMQAVRRECGSDPIIIYEITIFHCTDMLENQSDIRRALRNSKW